MPQETGSLDSLFEEIVLERVMIGATSVLSTRPIMGLKLDILDFLEDRGKTLALQMTGYLWGEPVHHEEVRFPADWWQAFKKRWFPKWAKRRWPPKHREVVLDAKAIYLEYLPRLPNERVQIVVRKRTK